ncbi:unnamed protein product [Protopolystoma xenopodis]|uniref:Ribosome biogenesis regulatory protein n=1 Tax=Protopolystoma xenopodis TaxID=117903 RepID=A0A3S5B0H2_9PLAT|nr:unnamed protein product [Protopolystoma xenopodis]
MTDLRLRLADIDLGNLLFEDKAPLQNVCGDKICLSLYPDFLASNWYAFSLLLFQAPKTRDLARWERYARIKGIHNKKKSKKVWDETTKSWKPRWGKGRADDIKDKWVLEVPDNAGRSTNLMEFFTQIHTRTNLKSLRDKKLIVLPRMSSSDCGIFLMQPKLVVVSELFTLPFISLSLIRVSLMNCYTCIANPAGILAEVELNKSGLSQAYRIASTSDASLGRFTQDVNIKKIKKKTE